MGHLPSYIYIVFIPATLAAMAFFYVATNKSNVILVILALWMALQGIIGYSGFYTITNTTPPRVVLLLLPPMLCIVLLFLTTKGRLFIDSLDLKYLTLLHIVRIPVELTLLWLFMNKAIPQVMTFEGRNFDILSGITAPIIFYFGFVNKKLSRKTILLWNFICLGLVINIVTIAILAMPTTFQQIAFNQPNTGVLYFPFIWLPCIVVPIVMFAHLASVRQLLKS